MQKLLAVGIEQLNCKLRAENFKLGNVFPQKATPRLERNLGWLFRGLRLACGISMHVRRGASAALGSPREGGVGCWGGRRWGCSPPLFSPIVETDPRERAAGDPRLCGGGGCAPPL